MRCLVPSDIRDNRKALQDVALSKQSHRGLAKRRMLQSLQDQSLEGMDSRVYC
jgi:hypothetical protein